MLAQYKTSEYEPLYMLVERKTRQREKVERAYFIKQKFSGLLMFTIGVLTPLLLDGDATISLVSVPIGIGLILTKQKIMLFGR